MKPGVIGGALLALGAAAVGLSACSPAANDDEATGGHSYQGLGSRWAIEFAGDTFTLTYDEEVDGTNEMTIEGTFEEFENRFRLLTITESEGENARPSAATLTEWRSLAMPSSCSPRIRPPNRSSW